MLRATPSATTEHKLSAAWPPRTPLMVKAARDRWGRLDILVNNASVARDAMIHLMSDEWFAMMMEVTVKGTLQCIRAAAPLMRGRAHSRQTGPPKNRFNIASTAGIYGAVGKVSHPAAKAAVIGITKTVAREWAPFLVNCNAVAPGVIAAREEASKPENVGVTDARSQPPTQATTQADYSLESLMPGSNPWCEQIAAAAAETVDKTEQRMPMGRIGRPNDVAGAVAFLPGPDSDFITGTVLDVHGGMELMNLIG